MSKGSMAPRGLTLVASLICAAALPAGASATTLWVSNKTPSAPFTNCEHPGYSHIQEAVRGPGTAIHVCAGTYEEQVQIERSVAITGYGAPTLKLPATTADATSACDKANEELVPKKPDQDAISICGGKVAIKNLNVDAIWPGEPVGPSISCAYNLTGILVAGGANLTLSGATVTGAAPQHVNGCQYGVGVLVGVPESGSIGEASATLSDDTIAGYDKNGIAVAGAGVQAKISKVTVTGAGPTEALAQNGIGIQEGARATVADATISGNVCTEAGACGPDELDQAAGAGLYFFDAAAGSSVKTSTIAENGVGVEAFDAPSTDPVISGDKIEDSDVSAVEVGEGAASVDNDTLASSEVGIEVLQYAGQRAAAGGTASHDTITGMSKWAVLGRSDKGEGDLFTEFAITASKISGNPGHRPLESVESENPATLKIFAEKDT